MAEAHQFEVGLRHCCELSIPIPPPPLPPPHSIMQVSPRGSESSTDSAAAGQQSSGAATGEASAPAASGHAARGGAFDVPSFAARSSPRKHPGGWSGRSMVAGGEINPAQKIAHQDVFLGTSSYMIEKRKSDF